MSINSLVLNENDNVAVALEPLKRGTLAKFESKGQLLEITISSDIPIYHKYSILPIAKGSRIYKYGEAIGLATNDISVGVHIHKHNLISVREKPVDMGDTDENF